MATAVGIGAVTSTIYVATMVVGHHIVPPLSGTVSDAPNSGVIQSVKNRANGHGGVNNHSRACQAKSQSIFSINRKNCASLS